MMKKKIITKKAPAAIGTYSQAIVVENFVFISGQIPLNYSDMSVSTESFENKVSLVLNNINEIAHEAGSDINHCVKFTVYLKDLENFSKVNTVMESYLDEPYPARAAVEVSRLPKDVDVEIDAILYKK